jgi:hypothetical protein
LNLRARALTSPSCGCESAAKKAIFRVGKTSISYQVCLQAYRKSPR